MPEHLGQDQAGLGVGQVLSETVHRAHAEGAEGGFVVVLEFRWRVGHEALGDEVFGAVEVFGVLEHAGEGDVDGGLGWMF